jgi:hypothetical protein
MAKVFNRQAALNKAYKHLMKQKEKSVSPSGPYEHLCAYRGAEKRRCAIGWLIPDRLYEQHFETRSVRAHSVQQVICRVFGIRGLTFDDVTFLRNLQAIHDVWDPTDWRNQFKLLAKKWDLTLPKLK